MCIIISGGGDCGMCRNFVTASLIATVIHWKSELHILQVLFENHLQYFFRTWQEGQKGHHQLPAYNKLT
jgi:hypothetical protein